MTSSSKSHLYLNPFCVPQLDTMTTVLLQRPTVAAQMAYITVGCPTATVLRVHLEEPALHTQVLSHNLCQCLMKLNQKKKM